MDNKVLIVEETASSNTYAMKLANKEIIEEGTVVWVKKQTQGRGQSNHIWHSEPNQNLTVSFILYPSYLPLIKQFYLSKAVALGVYLTVKKFCKKDVRVKWPNDIYVNTNKIAGILIENSIQKDEYKIAIVGVGLNVNQKEFPKDIPNPTSLLIESGKLFDLKEVLNELQTQILYMYGLLKKGMFAYIDELYNSVLYKKEEEVTLLKDNQSLKATILHVDENGLLNVIINMTEYKFAVGEVIWEK